MTEWIENTSGECPVPKGTHIDVKYRDGEVLNNVPALTSFAGRNTQCAFWELDGCSNDITEWRLHDFAKTLDDALGQQNATYFAEAFDAMTEAQWEGTYKYPETTYEPLPVQLPQGALVASIFNTLYPEPCVLREVHVEALKTIMKLVEERGGE